MIFADVDNPEDHTPSTVLKTLLVSCRRERLAWESAAEEIEFWDGGDIHCVNVRRDHVRPEIAIVDSDGIQFDVRREYTFKLIFRLICGVFRKLFNPNTESTDSTTKVYKPDFF